MDENRSKAFAKDVGSKGESGVGSLTGDAKTQASGEFRQVEGTAQELLDKATHAVRDVAGDASVAIARAYEAGARTYAEGNRAVGRRIDENALAALLAAGAAGYALAWLIHSRR